MSDERNEEILDLWMTWGPEEMKYVALHGGALAAVAECRRMRKREPLVQEVIKIIAAYEGCDTQEEMSLGKGYLIDAARKLRDWQP